MIAHLLSGYTCVAGPWFPPDWAEWPVTPHMHGPEFYRDPTERDRDHTRDTAGAREKRYIIKQNDN